MGRYFEKIATPEYPLEHLQKFQYPLYPGSYTLDLSKASSSILVSPIQIISGLSLAIYFCKSYLFMTALIPFTFHEEINNLSGVFPFPYYHRCVLVFVSAFVYVPDENCFDLDLVVATGYGSITYSPFLPNNLVWISFLGGSFPTEPDFFLGGIAWL